MTLPKITTPIYTTILPSNKKSVEFRPLLVKDEKAIQLALSENKDELKTKLSTIRTIINDCTFGKLNIAELPFFDVEWLFINIRNKSVKSTIELQYTCDCGKDNEFIADLANTKISPEAITTKTKIDLGGVGISLKYPTYESLESYSSENNFKEYIRQFVDCIYTDTDVYNDFTTEEFSEWLDQLTGEQFTKIKEFFESVPTIELEVNHTCECGKKRYEKLRGLQSFLA